jgi:hypothetical protein
MDLSDAIAALTLALDECGSPAMLIGGIAVIARGIPRHTDDVDGTIAAEGVDLEEIVRILAKHEIIPRVPDAIQFAQQHQVLLLVHTPSATEIELSLAWLPFEQEALARAERLDIGAVQARVATAEDLVIYKAVAWRERDKSDIEQLIQLHSDQIDFGRVERIIGEFAAALEEPERIAEPVALTRSALAAGK